MVTEEIRKKIGRCKRGTIFFVSSFPGYDEEYVRKVLAQLVEDGTLLRLSNGVFLKPVKTRFGILYPDPDVVVKAIANRDHAKVLPNGYVALESVGTVNASACGVYVFDQRRNPYGAIGAETSHAETRRPSEFCL